MFEKNHEFIYKFSILVGVFLAIFFINVPVTIAMPKHKAGDARVTSFIAAKTAKPIESETLS
jgi:hypothetical protein